MRWATRDQRPDLPGVPSRDVWPEYNLHGDVVGRMWHRLYDDVGHMQSIGWDDATGDVLVEANAVACVWDGTDCDLGPGIDAVMRRAFADLDAGRPPTALCALTRFVRFGVSRPRTRRRHRRPAGRAAARCRSAGHMPGTGLPPRCRVWPARRRGP